MDIHVDFVPDPSAASRRASADGPVVSVVVDVLGSATTVALLFERGAPSVTLTPSVRAARSAAEARSALLIGDRDGMPPVGFNHGGSPSLLRDVRLDERPAVLLAADSPAALAAAATSGVAWLAGLTNVGAVVTVVAASGPARVEVICAGHGGAPDLADTIAAGLLVTMLDRALRGGTAGAVTLSGAALYCASVLRTAKDPLDGIWASSAGAALRTHGLEEDLALASVVASSDVAPSVDAVDEVLGKPLVRLTARRR